MKEYERQAPNSPTSSTIKPPTKPIGKDTLNRPIDEDEAETEKSTKPVEKTAAQTALFDYREGASAFIDGNHDWLVQNWTHYLARTSGNPLLGWSDGLLDTTLSGLVGSLTGVVVDKVLDKTGKIIAATLIGSMICPGAGTIIGFVIGVLVEVAASMLFDRITGADKETSEAASAASRRTGALVEAQYGNLAGAKQAATGELAAGFRATQLELNKATDQATVDRIEKWAIAEKAQTLHAAPITDRSLALAMLYDWVLEHAGDEEDQNRNTDEVEFDAARDEIFGVEHLDYHRELFAFQTRHEWGNAGLDTEPAQAMIDELLNVHAEYAPSNNEATAHRRFHGKRYTLPVTNVARWGQYWRQQTPRPEIPELGPVWDRAAAAIDTGDVKVDCLLDLSTSDGSCYVDWWSFDVWYGSEHVNQFDVSPD